MGSQPQDVLHLLRWVLGMILVVSGGFSGQFRGGVSGEGGSDPLILKGFIRPYVKVLVRSLCGHAYMGSLLITFLQS